MISGPSKTQITCFIILVYDVNKIKSQLKNWSSKKITLILNSCENMTFYGVPLLTIIICHHLMSTGRVINFIYSIIWDVL